VRRRLEVRADQLLATVRTSIYPIQTSRPTSCGPDVRRT
jgi:hypothetical protein